MLANYSLTTTTAPEELNLQNDIIDPVVMDLLNGKVPLAEFADNKEKGDEHATGYESVHNFVSIGVEKQTQMTVARQNILSSVLLKID